MYIYMLYKIHIQQQYQSISQHHQRAMNTKKILQREREGRDYIYNLGRETAVPWQIHDHGHPLLYFEPL